MQGSAQIFTDAEMFFTSPDCTFLISFYFFNLFLLLVIEYLKAELEQTAVELLHFFTDGFFQYCLSHCNMDGV